MPLKIMSLNLRLDKPDPGEGNWRVRRGAIASLIAHYSPDLIGTQEGLPHQLLDLHRLLPDYRSVGGDRTGTGTGEHCAIFYSPRLQCRETGDFSLSDTPEVLGSLSREWGNPVPRMVTWAVFALAGTSVTLLNTHLDYHSATARERGAQLLRDRLGSRPASEAYCFVTGDFNAVPASLPRQILTRRLANGIQLNDALAGLPPEQQLSFHDFTGQGSLAVDTIYFDSRLSLQAAKVESARWPEVLPSDHFPILAEFAEPHR
ncbi:MAG: endonuclease/exonuclease/phosphatase family protein [Cyanophyceae cyanobacterium]